MTHPTKTITAPILHPQTGELVNLDAPTNELADLLDTYRQIDSESRRAKTAITDELARRFDHEGRASHTAGNWKLQVNSPEAVTYQPDRVYAILQAAAEDGEISHDAVELACPPTGKRRVSKRDLTRVLAVLPDERADEIRRLAQPDARRITLTRLADR